MSERIDHAPAPPYSPLVATSADAGAGTVCPGCDSPIVDAYCSRCGESRPAHDSLTLRHLAGEFAEHLTNLDFRLVRTLVALVRRPGSLTVDYVAGCRNRFVRPLALYLLVSGGFFVLTPHLPGNLVSPATAVATAAPGTLPARMFDPIAKRRGETRRALAARVAQSPLLAPRATAALLAPAIAGLLLVLLAGRRRLIAEHVLFAIHLQTFLLVHVAATLALAALAGRLSGVIERAFGTRFTETGFALLLGPILLAAAVILVGHVYRALRRVYALNAGAAAWRAAALLSAVPVTLAALRYLIVYGVALVP